MGRALPLIAIGLAAGFLSALFGVGGGILVVPLLMTLLGFEVKRATATSLFAIGFTAVFGATRYGLSGHVHWVEAVLVGIPAMLGVNLGVALQRRVSGPRLQLGFACVVAVTGLKLVIG